MQANAGQEFPAPPFRLPDQTGLTAAVKPNPQQRRRRTDRKSAGSEAAGGCSALPGENSASDASSGEGACRQAQRNAANTGARPAARMINTSSQEIPAIREDPE